MLRDLVKTGRPVYADIEGLTLPGVLPLPDFGDAASNARGWHKLPEGSIVALDECQRAFPVRNPSTPVPLTVSEFQTHRHKGYDVLLITQGPRLLDRALFSLIGQHVHLYRPLGFHRAVVYRWQGVNDEPEPSQNRSNAERVTFTYDPELYAFYRSAVQHYVRPRIPRRVLLGLASGAVVVSLAASFLAFRLVDRFGGSDDPLLPVLSSTAGRSGDACRAIVGGVHLPVGCVLPE